jgi:hypothetical protein
MRPRSLHPVGWIEICLPRQKFRPHLSYMIMPFPFMSFSSHSPSSSFLKNRNSSVSIATGWKAGVRFLVGARFFSSPQHPDRLWGHPVSYPIGTGALSRGQGSQGMKLTTHFHLVPRSSAGWSYTCTSPYAFMA